MTVFYIITGDTLSKAVKLETSLLAMRRKKQQPDGSLREMLDELVLDEDNAILFKRLMNEAHADIITNISSNMLADTPTDMEPVLTEFPDFRQDMDTILYLNMHNDWPMQYKKSVDIKIRQYMIDYICWRWLETKSQEDAVTYQSRLYDTLESIRHLLVRKTGGLRIYPSWP